MMSIVEKAATGCANKGEYKRPGSGLRCSRALFGFTWSAGILRITESVLVSALLRHTGHILDAPARIFGILHKGNDALHRVGG